MSTSLKAKHNSQAETIHVYFIIISIITYELTISKSENASKN